MVSPHAGHLLDEWHVQHLRLSNTADAVSPSVISFLLFWVKWDNLNCHHLHGSNINFGHWHDTIPFCFTAHKVS